MTLAHAQVPYTGEGGYVGTTDLELEVDSTTGAIVGPAPADYNVSVVGGIYTRDGNLVLTDHLVVTHHTTLRVLGNVDARGTYSIELGYHATLEVTGDVVGAAGILVPSLSNITVLGSLTTDGNSTSELGFGFGGGDMYLASESYLRVHGSLTLGKGCLHQLPSEYESSASLLAAYSSIVNVSGAISISGRMKLEGGVAMEADSLTVSRDVEIHCCFGNVVIHGDVTVRNGLRLQASSLTAGGSITVSGVSENTVRATPCHAERLVPRVHG